MDATTARETLHGWIDDADDATVVSLAELLASLAARGLLPIAAPRPERIAIPFTAKVDDAPETNEERQRREGHEMVKRRIRESERRRDEAGTIQQVRYRNSQGQETDRFGNVLPPEEDVS